jgi:hypothetical protein
MKDLLVKHLPALKIFLWEIIIFEVVTGIAAFIVGLEEIGHNNKHPKIDELIGVVAFASAPFLIGISTFVGGRLAAKPKHPDKNALANGSIAFLSIVFLNNITIRTPMTLCWFFVMSLVVVIGFWQGFRTKKIR